MLWETVIGIETHVQLFTKSKIFSNSPNLFGEKPNSIASEIDLALPGTLPSLNEEAVKLAIKFGLAINGDINTRSIFARKNYFYPDLPKGYQISQFESPIIQGGELVFFSENKEKKIKITRAHLEEDAGKSVHDEFKNNTAIDLNRAGTPLLEIVTEPELFSSTDAVAYAKTLHSLVKWIGVCEGNLQEGNFRCDANVSVRKKGDYKLGTRREIKNLNSFKFLQQAIDYEISWQIEQLKENKKIIQATVLFDSDRGVTRLMRTKEDSHDYRYFPDPDLPPLIIEDSLIESMKKEQPALPEEIFFSWSKKYDLERDNLNIILADLELTRYCKDCFSNIKPEDDSKKIAKEITKFINGDILAFLNKNNIDILNLNVSPKNLYNLIIKLNKNLISSAQGKKVFEILCKSKKNIDEIIYENDFKMLTDQKQIKLIIEKIISQNPNQIREYLSGKEKALNYLVGQVMKESKGKADPKVARNLILMEIKK